MKKVLLLLLISLIKISFLYSQKQEDVVITVSPNPFSENQSVTLTVSNLNANWAGQDVYLWAWSYDSNDSNEQNSPNNGEWTNSNEAAKFTSNGDGTFSKTIVPTDYYSRVGIGRIGVLAKTKTGTVQSQDVLFEVGLFQLTILEPQNTVTVVNSGANFPIQASTTVVANFTLRQNGATIATLPATTNFSYTANPTGDSSFELIATDGSETVSRSFSVIVKPLVTQAPLPLGLVDGLNAHPTDNTRATFVLYAPGKEFVYLIGSFNNWQTSAASLMKFDPASDRFWLELTGLTPQVDILYQYLVDGTLRVADPYSTLVLDEFNDPFISDTTFPNIPDYPSAFTEHAVSWFRLGDTPYNWQVTDFERPAVTDLVVYELLIRDFDAAHSFDAVRARLDYLQELGVNAIELMPVNEFDGNISWGYNPSFHMALDKYYGTSNDLKEFVDACHARGIAVILDVVFNHATGQNPYFRLWNECAGDYNCKVTTENPFFNVNDPNTAFQFFNDFNHQSAATQYYMDRINKYWIDEFHIDGYRFDFTKGFTNTPGDGGSYDATRIALLKRMNSKIKEVDPNAYVILEHFAPNSEETELIQDGMLVWSNNNFNYNEATMGYHDSGKSNFSGISYLSRGWSSPLALGYMESHDEERLNFKNQEFGNSAADYNVRDLDTALDRMKMAGAFFFTVPGPKMIWQFGELGYDFSINYCVGGDIDNSCRTDPKPIRWDYYTEEARRELYENWSNMITLKLGEPIFQSTSFTMNLGNTNGLKSILLTKDSPNPEAITEVRVIGNFGVVAQELNPGFPGYSVWYDLADENRKLVYLEEGTSLTLAPGEFHIYSNRPSALIPNINLPDDDNDGVQNADDICPDTPLGSTVNLEGCPVFTLPSDQFAVVGTNSSCPDADNGSIEVAMASILNYTVQVQGSNGFSYSESFSDDSWLLENLAPASYEVCFGVENENYEQCFTVELGEPDSLDVYSVVDSNGLTLSLNLRGASVFYILLNDQLIQTSDSTMALPLIPGVNTLKVSTDRYCQGTFEEQYVLVNTWQIYPNPSSSDFWLGTNEVDGAAKIAVYDFQGRLVHSADKRVEKYAAVPLNLEFLEPGRYVLVLQTEFTRQTFKLYKQ